MCDLQAMSAIVKLTAQKYFTGSKSSTIVLEKSIVKEFVNKPKDERVLRPPVHHYQWLFLAQLPSLRCIALHAF